MRQKSLAVLQAMMMIMLNDQSLKFLCLKYAVVSGTMIVSLRPSTSLSKQLLNNQVQICFEIILNQRQAPCH